MKDHDMVGTALADWCRSNPSSAAQMIEQLRELVGDKREAAPRDTTASARSIEPPNYSDLSQDDLDRMTMEEIADAVERQPHPHSP